MTSKSTDRKVQRSVTKSAAPLALVALPALLTGLAATSAMLAPAVAAKKVSLQWFMNAEPMRNAWAKNVAKDYEERNPGIKVVLNIIAWDKFEDKLFTMFAAGVAPDVFPSWGASGFTEYATRGLLLNVDSLIKKDRYDMTDFIPTALKGSRFQGRYIGLPMYSLGSYTFYNKDLFAKAGVLEPPPEYDSKDWSWAGMVETAKKLTVDRNGDGRPEQFGVRIGISPFQVIPWLSGVDIFDDKSYVTGIPQTPQLESPAVVKAFEMVADLAFKHHVAPRPGESGAFETGAVAMAPMGGWGLWTNKVIKKFKWGAAALPHAGDVPKVPLFSDPWMISKQTKHPDEAWRFVKYLASPQVLLAMGTELGTVPSRKSVLAEWKKNYKSITASDLGDVVESCFKYGEENPCVLLVGYTEIDRVMNAEFAPLFAGKKPAAAVCKSAQARMTQLVKELAKRYAK